MAQKKHFGAEIAGWTAPPQPDAASLVGRYARLEALNADTHAGDLYRANSADDAIFDYLPYGPFGSSAGYHRWVRDITAGPDPKFYAIQNLSTGHFGGIASYLRITPESGSIEVGHINYAPEMQRTPAATEAMFLMMEWAFEAGYRRYEWKCDAMNLPSRRAAERLGFSYEGIFRQATVVKGRNRDTAWFAVIDKDWPALREAYRAWLSPGNFTESGQQVERLSDLTQLVRVSSDPLFART